ncbi:unnamed protein product [Echinostoma caproni]|uniref:Apple domain-containing protein n=1 Tax=Echinostoma caproni TaxID=27848 RepID=A0A183B3Y7_9TREM|nr:unnamed protein product [Echinostoma caproni]
MNSLARRWPHFHDLPFKAVPDSQVDILIGCDVPEAHWVMDRRMGGLTGDQEDRCVSRCFNQHPTAETASFFTMDEGAEGGCLVDQIQTINRYYDYYSIITTPT